MASLAGDMSELQGFLQRMQQMVLSAPKEKVEGDPILPSHFLGRRISNLSNAPRKAALLDVSTGMQSMVDMFARNSVDPNIVQTMRASVDAIKAVVTQSSEAHKSGWVEELTCNNVRCRELAQSQMRMHIKAPLTQGERESRTPRIARNVLRPMLFDEVMAGQAGATATGQTLVPVLMQKAQSGGALTPRESELWDKLDVCSEIATAKVFDEVRGSCYLYEPSFKGTLTQYMTHFVTDIPAHVISEILAFLRNDPETAATTTGSTAVRAMDMTNTPLDFDKISAIAARHPQLEVFTVTGCTLQGASHFDESSIRYFFPQRPNLRIEGAPCQPSNATPLTAVMQHREMLGLGIRGAWELYVRVHELDHIMFGAVAHDVAKFELMRMRKQESETQPERGELLYKLATRGAELNLDVAPMHGNRADDVD